MRTRSWSPLGERTQAYSKNVSTSRFIQKILRASNRALCIDLFFTALTDANILLSVLLIWPYCLYYDLHNYLCFTTSFHKKTLESHVTPQWRKTKTKRDVPVSWILMRILLVIYQLGKLICLRKLHIPMSCDFRSWRLTMKTDQLGMLIACDSFSFLASH